MPKRKKDRMTNEEFAAKVDNEGGFYEAATYGIKAEELEDDALAELWSEYRSLHEQMQSLEDEMQLIIDGVEDNDIDADDEDDDDEELDFGGDTGNWEDEDSER